MTTEHNPNVDWDAQCVHCTWSRREHFRASVTGGMKQIPTPDGKCHGAQFEAY